MKKKERRTLDLILIAIAVFLLAFVVAMIWLYYRTEGIPDTLCSCVFAACGGECGVMGWIKVTKERYRDRSFELKDRAYNEKLQKQQEEKEERKK